MTEWKKTFDFKSKKLYYNRIQYNNPSERAVEVPIGFDFLAANIEESARVLEVGNVLSCYENTLSKEIGIISREIVDKFEKGLGIDNQDLMELNPPDKYNLIVCISTVEHIGQEVDPTGGYGEHTDSRDREAPLKAIVKIYDLLAVNGKALITVPFGTLTDGRWYIQFSGQYLALLYNKYGIPKEAVSTSFLKLIDRDPSGPVNMLWEESQGLEVSNCEYSYPFITANAIAVIELSKVSNDFYLNLNVEPTPFFYNKPYGERIGAEQDKAQLHQTQTELEQSQSQLHQTQTELEQSQSQLHQTQTELEQSQSQLHQTQTELKECKHELGEFQVIAEQFQEQIRQTHAVLEESQSKLYQTQTELAQIKSQLYQSQWEEEKSRFQMQQTQAELLKTQSELHQIKGQLHQSQLQLDETQSLFKQSQSQMDKTESLLRESQSQVYQNKHDLKRVYHQLFDLEGELEQSQLEVKQSQTLLKKFQSQVHENKSEFKRADSQKHQIQQELENFESQLHQNQQELEQSQSQLHQIQQELENFESQLHQNQQELEQSQSQLHQIQQELEQSQSQLHQNQQELEQSQSQLHQNQQELKQSQSQLHQNQQELEQLKSQFSQAQVELVRTQLQHQPVTTEPQSAKATHYRLLVWDAWYAYQSGDLEKMQECLQESLKFTDLSRTESVVNWLDSFAKFYAEKGDYFDSYTLTNSAEWKQLTRRVIAVNSKLIRN
jgi:septal ring factor EnvC (AmiA/AmiB activator)